MKTTIELELVSIEDVQKGGKSKYTDPLEKELLPFLNEKLETMDSVILREKNLQNLLKIDMKSDSFKSKLFTLFKGRDIILRSGRHKDGSRIFIFKKINKKETENNV